MIVAQPSVEAEQRVVSAQKQGRDEQVEEICGKIISAIQGIWVTINCNEVRSDADIREVVDKGEAFCEALLELDAIQSSKG